jgi:hypothetical protein
MQLFRSGVVCFRGSGPSGINNREGRVGRDLCSALRLRLCKNVERLKFLRGGPSGGGGSLQVTGLHFRSLFAGRGQFSGDL